MIKYNNVEKTYSYDMKIIDEILSSIDDFYDKANCSKEDVNEFLCLIDKFIDSCKVTNTEVVVEGVETEEQARTYFGDDFIKEFDFLLMRLKEEQVVPALHTTIEESARSILNTGLEYKEPSIYSTAKIDEIAYNGSYDKYSGLLNGHYRYSYLVIVGIPYECFYDKPLWNHFNDSGEYDYKINPDFIVGYIDVLNKKIIYNKNYSRNHIYSGLVYDTDIYHKRNINNEEFFRLSLEYKVGNGNKNIESDYYVPFKYNISNNKFDDNISYAIELLKGLFNEIKGQIRSNYIINQEVYEKMLSELLTNITIMKMTLPYLKTRAELQADIDKLQEFNNNYSDLNPNDDFFVWGFDDKMQPKNR